MRATSRSLVKEMPPHRVWLRVVDALRDAGDPGPVRSVEPVRSGYESRAFHLRTRQGGYFLKWSEKVKPGRYAAEARGLALLRETNSVRVPRVLAVEDVHGDADPPGAAAPAAPPPEAGTQARATEGATEGPTEGGAGVRPGIFLMEWLDRPPNELYLRRVGAKLGTQLAALHRCSRFWGQAVPGYRRDDGTAGDGLSGGGFVADGWEPDWITFFRDRILRARTVRAFEAGRLGLESRVRLERLADRLETWLGGVEHQPSLLHGDLHRGNVLCDRDGGPALVDPYPSFGNREMEIADLETKTWSLFPPVFYAAYFEAWPAAPGRQERRDLYVAAHMLDALLRGDPRRALMLDALVHRYVGS